METVLRRAAVFDLGVSHLSGLLYMFGKTVEAENVHPLQSGLIRRKYRRDRRYGMPLESPLTFYPRCAKEFLVRYGRGSRSACDAYRTTITVVPTLTRL